MTTKIRIEWITLASEVPGGGPTVDQPAVQYGVQELITTGSTAVVSQAAPFFGLFNGVHVTSGVARITVIEGAAIVLAGVSPIPAETNGYRIVVGDLALNLPVQSGWQVAIIEAADAAQIPGGGAVSDAAAEASLAQVRADTDSLVTGQATTASLESSQDPIFDHVDGVLVAVGTAGAPLLTPGAGCKYVRFSSDADVLIRTDGTVAAVDAHSIQLYAKVPEVIPVAAGSQVSAITANGTANVRATPMKSR